MRAMVLSLSLLSVAALSPLTPARADNPVVQTIYTADPAPMVHDGRVYLYTGHDEDGSTGTFRMNDWRVFSSADMVNWTDHGSPMSIGTFSWAKSDAWAGHAIERNGKFYWYVPVTKNTGGMAIGVAVSESPTGPFKDALGKPLIENSEIDPNAFIDEDGQAYLYWGNPNLWYAKLGTDMISLAGEPSRIPLTAEGFGARTGNPDRATLYEEGPWVYKRNGLYYNVFAAECCGEFIGHSTAPTPTGPWTYRGTVMPRQGSSFTNHAGVIDFKGSSYFFYHNGALPGGGGFTRSVAVEKFTYKPDGSIPTIDMTAKGAPQISTLDPYVRQEAETSAWASGVETERSSDGGVNVSGIDTGDYIKVAGVGFGEGASSFTARIASKTGGGAIELRLDSMTGPVIGTCAIPATGGWQDWTEVSCPVSGATGTRDLYLAFTGTGGPLFNVDRWRFATETAAPSAIANRNSGQVIDVQMPNTENLAKIGQWPSNGTPWQQWRSLAAGNGTFTLQSVNSGKCLDILDFSTADGAAVIQYTCHGGTNQTFIWKASSDGHYHLVNAGSGKCLNVADSSTSLGAHLELRTCAAATSMQWSRT